jgi:hypothetical protein
MFKTWPKVFQSFVTKRLLELYETIFRHDPEYVGLHEELSRETERLIAGLGPEKSELYQNYESAANILENRKNELCYQQGLNDGVRLASLVDRIRQGEK